MTQTLTREELEAWDKHILGKPCPRHPERLLKRGKFGTWCGQRMSDGTWCSGGWPTDEWLAEFRNK